MTFEKNHVLGIDIGGTGIKMAVADVMTGELLTERFKELTPKPATPEAVLDKVVAMKEKYFPKYNGPIGCGFPAVVKYGVAKTAANVDKNWIGTNIDALLHERLGMKAYTANDADLAGLAEFTHGSGKESKADLIIFLTVGTGIGSALFFEHRLIQNTELGHLLYKGDSYEKYASNKAREEKDLSWKEWGKRLNSYLKHVSLLLNPDEFIIGGGVSKKLSKFEKYLNVSVPLKAAELMNAAGVIGAAVYAYEHHYKINIADAN